MEQAEYALMDAAEERMWWYRALHLRLLAALPGTGRVLDAGCGTGGLLARDGAVPGRGRSRILAAAAVRAAAKSGRSVVPAAAS